MFTFIRRVSAMAGVLMLLGTAAQATPVNILEGNTDFDTAAPFGEVLGTLGAGTNTISGTIDFTCIASGTRCGIGGAGDSGDAIRLRLAQNTRLLAGGSFTATNASVDGAVEVSSAAGLVGFGVPFGGTVLINSLNLPTEGPTDIFFFVRAALNGGVTTGRHSFDYTFTFDVEWIEPPATVPLPAGGLLLATALGAGGLLRRRPVMRA